MFYAIRNPYGNNTINANGTQANTLYQFTRRDLRDAWVQHEPTHREALTAHDPRIRAARKLPYAVINDGDGEAWYALAERRVISTPALYEYRDILLGDDYGEPANWRWIAREPVKRIVDWAAVIRWQS